MKVSGTVDLTAAAPTYEMYVPDAGRCVVMLSGDAIDTPSYTIDAGIYDPDEDVTAWRTLHTSGALSADEWVDLDLSCYEHARITLTGGTSGRMIYTIQEA